MGERKLNFYGKGIQKTKAGHLRYTSPKELRGKYVHRHVVDVLLSETPFSVKQFLPWPYEVHHVDYNKTHNCPNNLLLLSPEFHSCLTADRARGDNGAFGRKDRFSPKWKPAPEWKLFDEDDPEVPF